MSIEEFVEYFENAGLGPDTPIQVMRLVGPAGFAIINYEPITVCVRLVDGEETLVIG